MGLLGRQTVSIHTLGRHLGQNKRTERQVSCKKERGGRKGMKARHKQEPYKQEKGASSKASAKHTAHHHRSTGTHVRRAAKHTEKTEDVPAREGYSHLTTHRKWQRGEGGAERATRGAAARRPRDNQ